MGNHWRIHLPEVLADSGSLAELSPRGLRLATYWTEIVAQASNYEATTTLRCRRRPQRRPCNTLPEAAATASVRCQRARVHVSAWSSRQLAGVTYLFRRQIWLWPVNPVRGEVFAVHDRKRVFASTRAAPPERHTCARLRISAVKAAA